jgi:hypothetical protein
MSPFQQAMAQIVGCGLHAAKILRQVTVFSDEKYSH